MKKIAFYFTIATLVFFVVSMFSVLLSTPAEVNPSGIPSPSVEPPFRGAGQGAARVVAVGNRFLVQCKGATEASVRLVESVLGVQTAFRTGSDFLVVMANLSASPATLNSSESDEGVRIARDISEALALSCSEAPKVLRAALVETTAPVSLRASDGSNSTRTMFPREVSGFGIRTEGLPGAPAYLDGLSARANSTVLILVSVAYEAGALSEFNAEQLSIEIVPTNSTSE